MADPPGVTGSSGFVVLRGLRRFHACGRCPSHVRDAGLRVIRVPDILLDRPPWYASRASASCRIAALLVILARSPVGRLRITRNAKGACNDLEQRLRRVQEKAEYKNTRMYQQNGVSYPTLGRLADSETGHKRDRQKNRDESRDAEECVIGVHAGLVLERPETVEGQDEDDLADSQHDDLCNAARLYSAEGDTTHEGDEYRYERERSSTVAVRLYVDDCASYHTGRRPWRYDQLEQADGHNRQNEVVEHESDEIAKGERYVLGLQIRLLGVGDLVIEPPSDKAECLQYLPYQPVGSSPLSRKCHCTCRLHRPETRILQGECSSENAIDLHLDRNCSSSGRCPYCPTVTISPQPASQSP
ncbi:hypothetical protein KC341_g82 [Hortaea werneckii]|nr:hypothetical protein KC341_g82 [Hortaea werneckii]